MERRNVMEERYTTVWVLGKTALFHDLRIDRKKVPEGLYLYEVRHDDEGWVRLCRLQKRGLESVGVVWFS